MIRQIKNFDNINIDMKTKILKYLLILPLVFFTGCSLTTQNDGGILKSRDVGKTWDSSNTISDSQESLIPYNTVKLVSSPYNSAVVYLITQKNGFYKSTDFGDTWSNALPQVTKVYDLWFNPFRDGVAYASILLKGRGKIIKTTDKGEFWDEIHTETANGTYIKKLAVSPHKDNYLIAVNSEGLLTKSTDDGGTWQGLYNFTDTVKDIFFDNEKDNEIWALTDKGIMLSDDNGSDFRLLTEQRKSLNQSNDYYLLKKINNMLFVSTDQGLFISTNKGENWDKLFTLNNPGIRPVKAVTVFPNEDDHWAAGAGMTIYLTTDRGKSWKSSQLTTAREVSSILINQNNTQELLLGVYKKAESLIPLP